MGLVAPGNLDINARKVYRGPGGDFRTENSISIGTDQGEVIIPTVVNGRQLTEEEAIRHYEQTGENLGAFSSPDAAEKYAESLHNRQEQYYSPFQAQQQEEPKKMGLLEMFGVGDNPFYQAFDQNRGKITNAFAGMVGAGNDPRQALTGWTQGLQHGVNVDTERAIIAKQEAEKQAAIQAETAKQNQTLEWLKANAPEYADAVANNVMTAGDAWSAVLKAKQPKAPIKAAPGDTFLDPVTYEPISSVPDPKATLDANKDSFANEKDLFAQYSNSDPVKTYEAVKGGYERVRQSAALDTGAGDMGLIYGYMKMLDPGSVVRESEFAMAAQTGSYGEQIQGLVQRVLTGERLTPSQRQAFQDAAAKLYEESSANLADINMQFSDRANRYNVNPGFIRAPEVYRPLASIADIKSKYGLE